MRITSRDATNGAAVAKLLRERFKGTVESITVRNPSDAQPLLGWAQLLLAAGPPGVRLVPRQLWAGQPALRAVADVNAVPPLGIEGVEATDDGTLREGIPAFGALGIGGLKMKAHKAAIAGLFERNDLVLDAEQIYDLAAAL